MLDFLHLQNSYFRLSADQFWSLQHQFLRDAKVPIYDISTAIDVLYTGTYNRLPSIIERTHEVMHISPPPFKPSQDESLIKSTLDQHLLIRIMWTKIPIAFQTPLIKDGLVEFIVKDEFKTKLTLLDGVGLKDRWTIMSLEIFVSLIPSLQERLHSMHLDYLKMVVQRIMDKSKEPISGMYEILHSFCQSLQLDILYQQALNLQYLVKIDSYKPGGQLVILVWTKHQKNHPERQLKISIATQSMYPKLFPRHRLYHGYLEAKRNTSMGSIKTRETTRRRLNHLFVETSPPIVDPITKEYLDFDFNPRCLNLEQIVFTACDVHVKNISISLVEFLRQKLANSSRLLDKDGLLNFKNLNQYKLTPKLDEQGLQLKSTLFIVLMPNNVQLQENQQSNHVEIQIRIFDIYTILLHVSSSTGELNITDCPGIETSTLERWHQQLNDPLWMSNNETLNSLSSGKSSSSSSDLTPSSHSSNSSLPTSHSHRLDTMDTNISTTSSDLRLLQLLTEIQCHVIFYTMLEISHSLNIQAYRPTLPSAAFQTHFGYHTLILTTKIKPESKPIQLLISVNPLGIKTSTIPTVECQPVALRFYWLPPDITPSTFQNLKDAILLELPSNEDDEDETKLEIANLQTLNPGDTSLTSNINSLDPSMDDLDEISMNVSKRRKIERNQPLSLSPSIQAEDSNYSKTYPDTMHTEATNSGGIIASNHHVISSVQVHPTTLNKNNDSSSMIQSHPISLSNSSSHLTNSIAHLNLDYYILLTRMLEKCSRLASKMALIHSLVSFRISFNPIGVFDSLCIGYQENYLLDLVIPSMSLTRVLLTIKEDCWILTVQESNLGHLEGIQLELFTALPPESSRIISLVTAKMQWIFEYSIETEFAVCLRDLRSLAAIMQLISQYQILRQEYIRSSIVPVELLDRMPSNQIVETPKNALPSDQLHPLDMQFFNLSTLYFNQIILQYGKSLEQLVTVRHLPSNHYSLQFEPHDNIHSPYAEVELENKDMNWFLHFLWYTYEPLRCFRSWLSHSRLGNRQNPSKKCINYPSQFGPTDVVIIPQSVFKVQILFKNQAGIFNILYLGNHYLSIEKVNREPVVGNKTPNLLTTLFEKGFHARLKHIHANITQVDTVQASETGSVVNPTLHHPIEPEANAYWNQLFTEKTHPNSSTMIRSREKPLVGSDANYYISPNGMILIHEKYLTPVLSSLFDFVSSIVLFQTIISSTKSNSHSLDPLEVLSISFLPYDGYQVTFYLPKPLYSLEFRLQDNGDPSRSLPVEDTAIWSDLFHAKVMQPPYHISNLEAFVQLFSMPSAHLKDLANLLRWMREREEPKVDLIFESETILPQDSDRCYVASFSTWSQVATTIPLQYYTSNEVIRFTLGVQWKDSESIIRLHLIYHYKTMRLTAQQDDPVAHSWLEKSMLTSKMIRTLSASIQELIECASNQRSIWIQGANIIVPLDGSHMIH